MRWFGQSWDAPINYPQNEVPVPVGVECLVCQVEIESTDSGVTVPFYGGGPPERAVYHRKCFLSDLGIPDE